MPYVVCGSKNVASSAADDHVGLVDPVERAAGAHAVDGSDQRLPDPILLRAEEESRVVLAPWVGVAGAAVDAVDAGREGTLAVGPQDDHQDVVVDPAAGPDVAELVEHLLVEAVETLGPVEGHRGDVVGNLEADRLVGLVHDAFPSAPCFGSRGRPSTRSATRVLRISSVPPAMR